MEPIAVVEDNFVVVKVLSSPLALPNALTPYTLKWYVVLGVRPEREYDTAVVVDPVTRAGLAVTTEPYDVEVPYSK